MVTFATLILTLVTGGHPVEVLVDPAVAAVEIRLDGEVAGRMTGEPWRLVVDFGAELEPHELVAVAFDEKGRELSRDRQMVNLPRPTAEVALSLERGPEGRYRTARAAWEATGGLEMEQVQAFFDGDPVEVGGSGRIEIPAYDPEALHHLVVQVRFDDGVQAEAAAALGGMFGDSTDTEITAVAIELDEGLDELPSSSLDGWFRLRGTGEPLRVVAAEKRPAAVLLVRDRSAEGFLRPLVLGDDRPMELYGRNRSYDGLRPGDTVHLMDTIPSLEERDVGSGVKLFPISPDLSRRWKAHGVTWALTRLRLAAETEGETRPAQATAAAGLHAAGLGRARAVVLVLGPTATDEGPYGPSEVVDYLQALQVPFRLWYVGWSVGEEPPPQPVRDWGGGTHLRDSESLFAALEELRAALDRQRIVWLEGRHLPQRIELTEAAREHVELAGGSARRSPPPDHGRRPSPPPASPSR